jgi:hypothetical protein
MVVSYVIAYVLCTASSCQLVMPDSAVRYACAVECEAQAPGLPASYDRLGALATRTCVAVPSGAAAAPKRNAPARQHVAPAEPEVPDAATEALNARQMELLRMRDRR